MPDTASLADRQRVIGEHPLEFDDVAYYVRPNPEHYDRAPIFTCEKFQLLLLTWKPGQKSPIHNHRGSQCVLRVVQGVAVETTYELKADSVYSSFTLAYKTGATIGGEDLDIHRVENMPCATEDLITLHAYFPKLEQMDRFYILENRLLRV